jgi:parallel beta-helix repeat protein
VATRRSLTHSAPDFASALTTRMKLALAGRSNGMLMPLCLAAAAFLLFVPEARAQALPPHSASASPGTVYVAPPTGEKEEDRASILAALEEVRPGGTVQFAPGTYLVGELIRVTTSDVTLLGHPDGTILRGCHPSDFVEFMVAGFACNGLELAGGRQTVRDLTFEYAWHGLFIGCCFPSDLAEMQSADGPPHRHDQPGGHLIEGNTFRNSSNGMRVVGRSAEPIVIRDNRFINTFHALVINGGTAHFLDNDISTPDPAAVPIQGRNGGAIIVMPDPPVRECGENIIAGNRILDYADAILIYVPDPGTRCERNVVRNNTIVVRRNPLGNRREAITMGSPFDTTVVGIPVSITNRVRAGGSSPSDAGAAGVGADAFIGYHRIEGNRIIGADGLGIEIRGSSGNRIADNHLSDIKERIPFPGNTTHSMDPEAWRDANGSGIWISAGSDGNVVAGNTFDAVAGPAVFLEGDNNRVELRSASDTVRDQGSSNRVSGPGGLARAAAPAQAGVPRPTCQHHRQPPTLDDGWRTATPEDLGLTCEPLVAMTEAIRRDDYRNVHAVLIVKDGHLVYEEYFTGTDRRPESSDYSETVTHAFDRNTLHTTRSAGKSFTSALVGVALASGAIEAVDRPVLDFFPELRDAAEPAARAITVEQVLTMSAGFDWNETDYTNPVNHERALARSEDPAGFVLGRAVAAEPGSRWNYNSGLPTLLGLLIHRTTGQLFGAFAREHLFAPLGIQRVDWTGPEAWVEHPAFVWEGDEPWSLVRSAQPAGSLWLRPRDMLKFGHLYLNGGRWNGRQVMPESWVAASLEPHVPRSVQPIEYPNGVMRNEAYGYQWWHDRFELPYGEVTVHSASGNGGQKIWVVSELGLTAVHLAGNYNVPGNGWEAERLLLERIVPWAMGIPASYRHQPSLRPIAVDADEWPLVELPASERARYVGTYEEDGQPIKIRELNGRLQIVPPIGMGPIDLIPQGNHSFAVGVVDDGVVTSIYHPVHVRYVFVFDAAGEAIRYEVTGPEGVDSIGERLR